MCFRYSPKATWIGVPVLKRFNTDSKSLGGQTAVTFKSIIAGLRGVLNASTSREIDAAFASIVRERLDALFVAIDPFLVSRRAQLVNLASRHAC